MTKRDDKLRIKGAQTEADELRRKCLEGTERYAAALVAAGYLPARQTEFAATRRAA